MRAALATIGILSLMVASAAAQWLTIPLPGTPRTPDGKPNLTAPAPMTPDRKPDLSGIWQYTNRPPASLAGEAEVPMLPWAAAVHKERVENLGRDKPQNTCMPHGVPDAMLVPIPFKIIQTPGVTLVLFEEFNTYRQIFTDGRSHPDNDPNPAWYGYSIAKWDGDVFVVDTTGFKEGTWLDNGGHPHTDALRTTERFRRRNFGSMELEVTIDDSKAYSRPWKSMPLRFNLKPDTELIEHLCENEKDAAHIVGDK